jgi:3D (Asp-Asp-Asp) domain-containing protein
MDWRTMPPPPRGRGGTDRRVATACVAMALTGAVILACAPGLTGGGDVPELAAPPALIPSAHAAMLLPVPAAPPPAVTPQLAAELEESVRAAAAPPSPPARDPFPVAARLEMSATAYCLRGNMRTGVRTRDGMAAGDPAVLPLGSVVRVAHPDGRPVGIFVIMDTGGAIRGNKIDIYMESCADARQWGRRPVVAEVLEVGRV